MKMISRNAVVVACGIAILGSGAAQAGFGDFLKKLNPTAARYETFEGKYFDKVLADAAEASNDVNRITEQSPTGHGGDALNGAQLVRFHADSLLGNRKLNAYMESIIAKLLKGTPWEQQKWQVFVSVNRTHNAQTYPDGTVVLTLPMLLDIESEDELAMLLAHEVSHVIHEHHGSDWFADSQKRLVAASETSVALAEQLVKQMPQAAGSNLGDVQQKIRVLSLIKGISTDLLYPEWQRGQEEEADLLGMDLMIRAGYNPDEVFTLFEKQQQAAERVAAEDQSKEEREAQLNQQIQEAMTTGGFQGMFQGLGDALLSVGEALRADLKRTHPEYDKRLEYLASYREREYAEFESPDSSTRQWQRLRGARATKALLNDYKLAFEAGHLTDTGDVPGASSLVYKLRKSQHRREPYIQQVSAQLRKEQGQNKEAKTYLEQAVRDKRAGYPIYDDLAYLVGNAGHPGEAVRILRTASKRFANLPSLRMSLIYWTNQAGDTQTATQLALDCRLAYPDFDKDCAKQLKAPVLQRAVVDLGPGKPVQRRSRAEVKKLQTILNRLGYPVGTPDGLAGKKTREAVSRFQRDAKLPQSGAFDDATANKLNALNPET